jgi:hypothetical protein
VTPPPDICALSWWGTKIVQGSYGSRKPGKPRKVREFEMSQGKPGKVREFFFNKSVGTL